MAPRTTLITGSRSGMGRAVATLLTGRGERVIGVDLADAEIVADLSQPAERTAVVETVRALCPDGLDAAIACAGLATADGPRMISVNYFGVVDLIVGLQPLLVRGQAPRAVVIASSANVLPSDPELVDLCLAGREADARRRAQANETAYASSKLALTRWIRRTAIAPGWAKAGVLLNGVAPGIVRTPMIEPLLGDPGMRAHVLQSAPFATPEMARPEDLAPLLMFLAGPENRYMVGQVPFCDGGADVTLRGDDVLAAAPSPY